MWKRREDNSFIIRSNPCHILWTHFKGRGLAGLEDSGLANNSHIHHSCFCAAGQIWKRIILLHRAWRLIGLIQASCLADQYGSQKGSFFVTPVDRFKSLFKLNGIPLGSLKEHRPLLTGQAPVQTPHLSSSKATFRFRLRTLCYFLPLIQSKINRNVA